MPWVVTSGFRLRSLISSRRSTPLRFPYGALPLPARRHSWVDNYMNQYIILKKRSLYIFFNDFESKLPCGPIAAT